MEFVSANPSVVRSIKQRVLLNAWLRAARKQTPLPAISDFQPDGLADELADMMAFEVDGTDAAARFFVTQDGSRLAAAYGRDHLDASERVNRYLDATVDPLRYARVLPCYRTCVMRKRPTYSISEVKDREARTSRSSACSCPSAPARMSKTSSAPTRRSASRAASRWKI